MKLWPMKFYQSLFKITMRMSRWNFSPNFSLEYLQMVVSYEDKNVAFYSLSHVLSDSSINSIQVRYQKLTFFVITEKYIELSSCY